MALTGIQIFKLLPKTNCKECGFPTCLAFAMNLAMGKTELNLCPYVTEEAKAQLQESRFLEAIGITRRFLDRAIVKKISQIRSRDIVRQAPRLLNGQVLHLQEGGMPWTRVVVDEMPEVLFVIYPDSDGNQYQLKTVPVEPGSFTAKRDLPKGWAGLRDQELAAVTGVPDSVFCHMNLFIGGAQSLEGAIRLAELALAA